MRRALLLTCFMLIIPVVSCAQAPRRYEFPLKRNAEEKYLVYVPQNYSSEEKYPLFIGLHRQGGPAADIVDQWGFYTNRDHYILLCPNFYAGYEFFRSEEDEKLLHMVDETKERFSVDPSRVFIAGFSTGGDFVQRFVFENPTAVTAAAIIMARNFREPPYSKKLQETRFLITAGGRDAISFKPAEELYDRMRAKGVDVEFEQFAPLGHIINKEVQETVMRFFKSVE